MTPIDKHLDDWRDKEERRLIEEALSRGGTVKDAAVILDISVRSLYRRCVKLKIPTPQRPRSRLPVEERRELRKGLEKRARGEVALTTGTLSGMAALKDLVGS